jgi:hypothetical protein
MDYEKLTYRGLCEEMKAKKREILMIDEEMKKREREIGSSTGNCLKGNYTNPDLEKLIRP